MAPTVLVAAEANDNYNTATTEKWVNDSSNTAVQLLDIMTCMGGAGGISRPGFANKSWIALVDEKECGIDNGDTSAQEKKATIQFSSTLAAAGGTQEIVGYMEQSDGNKVIMNMQIKKSAATLPFEISTSFAAASAVPPVAIKSSIIKTLSFSFNESL